ncbi:MAG TPA: hypothetical protein IGS17_01795 [Oscillatoriales cyanobacterium M59_W2019_021]|nr:MAG: hypothetical protein D6728_06300 [Cyanobacteria bacterium J055]HIK31728.1 hypothetical protein [Oscillatoriales cyanobacterium M4454_W2019_049]HIK49647.1 hypothetical protein [Oscillatoriales cyanobacterium M59_W2019_021]
MLGQFQQSYLRIEVDASATAIAHSLLYRDRLQQWLSPQTLSPGLPERLSAGLTYTSRLGPVEIRHHVELANDNHLRLILSGGIDGFHEWYWGDGWVQSRLEGVSLLPLKLAQTASLWRLKQYLTIDETGAATSS